MKAKYTITETINGVEVERATTGKKFWSTLLAIALVGFAALFFWALVVAGMVWAIYNGALRPLFIPHYPSMDFGQAFLLAIFFMILMGIYNTIKRTTVTVTDTNANAE